MLPGPVFFHELRAASRRRRTFVIRTSIGLLLLYLLISILGGGRYARVASDRDLTAGELADLGGELFAAVALLEFLLIAVLTPAYMAGSIAEDRQRKVLPYLLASPLGGAEIVLGKFAARLINLVTLLLSCLPIVSIASFLGGVDPAMIWASAGAALAMLVLFASISVCISLHCERPRDAIVATYAAVFFMLWGPVLLSALLHSGTQLSAWLRSIDPVPDWLIHLSPMLLFEGPAGLQRDSSGPLFRTMIAQAALAVPVLAWATFRLRPRERGSRVGRMRRFLGLGARREGPFRLLPRPRMGDRPMFWKECTGSSASSSRLRLGLMVLLRVAVAAGLAYALLVPGVGALRETLEYGYGGPGLSGARELLNATVRGAVTALYCLAGLIISASAATAFTGERERDTWISLIATPLERREIVLAKIAGAFWKSRWLLAGLLTALLVGLACGSVHPLGFLLAVGLTAFYLAFPAILGTYLSLRLKTSAGAIAATLGIVLFLNFGYLFCCIPVAHGGSEVFLAGVTPLFVGEAPCSYADLNYAFHLHGEWGVRLLGALILSVGFYGVTSGVIFVTCLEEFDSQVGRPRRSFVHPLERPNPAGIQFVDEAPEPGEVVFLPEDREADRSSRDA
ncbi:ABC-2 family transporter protein [Aquisphaera giovannonii]|uniref:ABC-2 family transporter protein n=1 Tax=Aquisphaera giovannonii TaxID=406548 RepID=A0A5B9W945_9BACT|nr:ABC transporter permease subunit [Aquisphaera giovannonii]QEH37128.1 ABC-2 family transporter protein [Aquisphaera giovannonii]